MSMEVKNWTIANEIILLGFPKNTLTNVLVFLFFSLIYLVTIVSNGAIVFIVLVNTHLRTPMYFFLANWSVIDLCNSSIAVPKLLIDVFSAQRAISLGSCLTQFKVLLLIATAECQLLAVMAYDRYVAICRPLHYPLLMKWSVCYKLSSLVWTYSFLVAIVPSFALPITLCYPNQINHFMCEILPVIKLSCDDTSVKEVVIFALTLVSLLPSFVFIVASYIRIIVSVLGMHSTDRSKPFLTCSSHIAVVSFYYGTGIIAYFTPLKGDFSNQEKYISVFYVIIAPMVNPLIYSLNNREVKKSLRKLISYDESKS